MCLPALSAPKSSTFTLPSFPTVSLPSNLSAPSLNISADIDAEDTDFIRAHSRYVLKSGMDPLPSQQLSRIPSYSNRRSGPHSEAPSWQLKARLCLTRREIISQLRWTDDSQRCLAFSVSSDEKAYQLYLGTLINRKMQVTLLLMSFFYITASLTTWNDSDWEKTLFVRGAYVFLLLVGFPFTFTNFYLRHIHSYSSFLSALTGLAMISEAALRDVLYSPFTVILIILYLVMGTAALGVQTRQSILVCVTIIGCYDGLCLVAFPHGDSEVPSTSVASYLLWYNFILMLTSGCAVYLSRTIEIYRRKEFLIMSGDDQRIESLIDDHLHERSLMQSSVNDDYNTICGVERKRHRDRENGNEYYDDDFTDEETYHNYNHDQKNDVLNNNDSKVDTQRAGETANRDDDSDIYGANNQIILHNAVGNKVEASGSSCTSKVERKVNMTVLNIRRGDGHARLENSKGVGQLRKRERGTRSESIISRSKSRNNGSGTKSSEKSEDCPGGNDTIDTNISRISDGAEDGNVLYSRNKTLTSPQSASSVFSAWAKKLEQGFSHIDDSKITEIANAEGVQSFSDFVAKLSAYEIAGNTASNNDPESALKPDPVWDEYKLVEEKDLPCWFSHPPNIKTAYRVYFSTRLCFASIFKMHNETLNIWTELIPLFFFLVAGTSYFLLDDVFAESSREIQLFVLIGSSLGIALRPLPSALAHTLHCQNRRAHLFWWGVDYTSICIAVLSQSMVYGVFTFYCLEQQKTFFLFSVCGLFCTTMISVMYIAQGSIRAVAFCVFVTFANVVPLAYQIVIKVKTKIIEDTVDSTEPWNYILMWCMTLGSFLLSVVVKTAGAPESCAAPGKHDIYFHSHQFWHVCVNISSVLNLLTWRTYMEWRLDTPCPA